MNGTYAVTVGDRGRFVVPAALRANAGLAPGLTTPTGLVVMTREQARSLLRREFGGAEAVADTLAERRASAGAEDAQ